MTPGAHGKSGPTWPGKPEGWAVQQGTGNYLSGWGRAMDDSERPPKRDTFLALLQAGWASLHLDARCSGVVVPAPFSSQAHLVLQYGRNMPIPITDLEVTEAGVSATLSFSRVSHRTYIPWHAVYAVTCTNGCGVLYREDMPADVALATPTDVGAEELQSAGAGAQTVRLRHVRRWARVAGRARGR